MTDYVDGSGAGVTVTIKYGKGYEESWAVFRGQPSEVRSQVQAYFGLNAEEQVEMTLHEVVLEATKLAHGTAAASARLGGKALGNSKAASTDGKQDPWATPSEPAKPAEPERPAILSAIDNCQTLDELKALWGDEADTIKATDGGVDAFKARGAALKAAAG